MAAHYPETDRDHAAWARLWAVARGPWERTEDLADILGVARSAVAQWATGARGGPWPALRAALREAARQHPTHVPRLVRALAAELLDARGEWVPEGARPAADYRDEAGDVPVALGELTAAVRRGAPASEVRVLADRLVCEAREAAQAAAAEAK